MTRRVNINQVQLTSHLALRPMWFFESASDRLFSDRPLLDMLPRADERTIVRRAGMTSRRFK